MPLVYRAMTRDGDKPKVGASARCLGVRVADEKQPNKKADVTVDDNGMVRPNTGGMSVAPSWRELPLSRIPSRLRDKKPHARGSNRDACWRMGEGTFEAGPVGEKLILRPDSYKHGLIEPSEAMLLDDFQVALAATQDHWSIDEE